MSPGQVDNKNTTAKLPENSICTSKGLAHHREASDQLLNSQTLFPQDYASFLSESWEQANHFLRDDPSPGRFDPEGTMFTSIGESQNQESHLYQTILSIPVDEASLYQGHDSENDTL